jgi:hypothetical protein
MTTKNTEEFFHVNLDDWMETTANPVTRFVSEIEQAETQREAADILARARDLLRSLSREDRDQVLREVTELVEEKPEI